jgi:hypothetical protein
MKKTTPSEERIIAVMGTDDATLAALYQSMLEEAGIPVFTRHERPAHLHGGHFHPGMHGYRLCVRESDAPRATALIEDFKQSADTGALLAGPDDPPSTGEADDSGTLARLHVIGMYFIAFLIIGMALLMITLALSKQ